jgi:hypothetical protein
MASEVTLHEDASAEYEAAFEWYFLRSEFAASRFAQEMKRAIGQISESPNRWPKAVLGVRKFLLQHFPFAIFYRELPTESKSWPLRMAAGNLRIGRTAFDNRRAFPPNSSSRFSILRRAHTIGAFFSSFGGVCAD